MISVVAYDLYEMLPAEVHNACRFLFEPVFDVVLDDPGIWKKFNVKFDEIFIFFFVKRSIAQENPPKICKK